MILVNQISAAAVSPLLPILGVVSGAIVLLSDILNIPLLWFLSRRHMTEVYISHVMEALTGEKTKGPEEDLLLISRKSSLLSKKR
jgi:hypothetical protein